MYIQFGKKNKKKLLFIHGFLGSNGDFLNYFPVNDLKKNYHLIFLNLEQIDNCFTFEEYIDKIGEKLLKRFGKIDVSIGYSLGGRVAINLKSKFPKLINKLILISSALNPPLLLEQRQKRLNSDKNLLKRVSSKKQLNIFLTNWYKQDLFHKLNNNQDTKIKIKNFNLSDIKRQKYLLQVLSVGNQPLIPINKLKSSIIYIYGKHDKKYSKMAKEQKLKRIEFKNSAMPLTYKKTCYSKKKLKKLLM